jgi:electron transfer flavoprotein alpha subunit
MSDYRDVLIFGEMEDGRLSSMTLELMGIGTTLSQQLKGELLLAVPGEDAAADIGKGYGFGATRVYAARDSLLTDYAPDAYLQAMEQMVQALRPALILFGQTDSAIDLAPRLAFRIKAAMALDCVDIRLDPEGRIELAKPVFGGKAHGVFGSDTLPLIASVRQGSFAAAEYDQSKQGEVISFSLSLDPARMRTKFLKRIQDDTLSLAAVLTSAPIVVSGGRGLKTKEGVDLLKETAAVLGGAVGGSRPAIDNGWLPSHLQIGLTGKRINPQIYMAVGISGSLQHMAGCLKSKTIVAINSDEAAPIFKMAHIGVVADYREVLEGFNEEMKRQRNGDKTAK